MFTGQTPRQIAEGAANRLCAYDALEAPGDYSETAQRIGEFLREFVLIVGPRMFAVAQKADPKDLT